ncbi:hypothetical protein D3C71_76810 [compost metagenome]
MILILCAIWFSFLYYFGYKNLGDNDSFGPVKLFTSKMIIMNIPYIYFIAIYPEKFPAEILNVLNMNLEDAFIYYSIVQTILYLTVLLGISIGKKKKITKFPKNSFISLKVCHFIIIISFFLGLYDYYKFLNGVGGLAYLLSNLSSRTELLNEGEGLGNAIFYLTISLILGFYSYFKLKSNLKLFILILLTIFSILIISSTGGRKNVLYLIIFIAGAYNYYNKPFKFRNIDKRYLIVGFIFITFYILFMPILRGKDGFENLVNGNISLVELLKIEDLVTAISYTYIDVFSSNYFNFNNYWYFNSTLDIFENFKSIPKYLKPPIDDGVYFRSIVKYNINFSPPTARGNMYESSWPIEHLGFSYANLGLIGIIVFSLILGYLFQLTYSYLLKNNYSPIFLYLYIFVIFNFNFSNLRLVQILSLLPILLFYMFIIKIIKGK